MNDSFLSLLLRIEISTPLSFAFNIFFKTFLFFLFFILNINKSELSEIANLYVLAYMLVNVFSFSKINYGSYIICYSCSIKSYSKIILYKL